MRMQIQDRSQRAGDGSQNQGKTGDGCGVALLASVSNPRNRGVQFQAIPKSATRPRGSGSGEGVQHRVDQHECFTHHRRSRSCLPL